MPWHVLHEITNGMNHTKYDASPIVIPPEYVNDPVGTRHGVSLHVTTSISLGHAMEWPYNHQHRGCRDMPWHVPWHYP
jgi:hypothetical protein